MFLSWEFDIKLCHFIQKCIYIYNILYKNRRLIIFSKYATNLKTTISQKSLKNLSFLLLLFKSNNFSFKKDTIDNIIYMFVTRDQNSYQWQCSILKVPYAKCLRFLWDIVVLRLVTYLICLNLRFLCKILYI